MSDFPRRPSCEGAVSASPPRVPGRRFSVIVCSRQLFPLQMLDANNVSACAFREHHRPENALHRAHKALLFGDQPRPQRTTAHGELPRHGHAARRESVVPPSPTPPLWAPAPLLHPARVPPLKGHLGHVDGPLGPPAGPHGLPGPARLPMPPPAEGQPPGAWMPTARRLLLEPAPRRVSVRSVPYGGPGSAFHRVDRGLPSTLPAPYYCGDVVYSMPVFGSLVVPLAASPRASPRPAAESPGVPPPRPPQLPSTPRPHVLRVLRPEELELKVPALGRLPPALPAPDTPLAARTKDDADRCAAERPSDRDGKEKEVAGGSESTAPTKDRDTKTPGPLTSPKAGTSAAAVAAATADRQPSKSGTGAAEKRTNKRQWLLRVVRENFNEQIGLLVERFVRRPRHDKSVRRVPGIGRKVNVNLQEFWKRSSNQERHMKTKDLLGMYSDSGMDWKTFQKWLTKDLQFMPSCAKLCALSLDIYQRYWSTDWDDNIG